MLCTLFLLSSILLLLTVESYKEREWSTKPHGENLYVLPIWYNPSAHAHTDMDGPTLPRVSWGNQDYKHYNWISACWGKY